MLNNNPGENHEGHEVFIVAFSSCLKFEKQGLQAFDALHLACAEGNADIFLTVDDKFFKQSQNFSRH